MFRHPVKTLAAVLLGATLAFAPAHARSVRDIKGNAVEIPDQVNRIADLWPANNQVVLLLGGADKLVGTVEAIHKRPWFAKVYPRIKKVPALSNGQTVQSEALLAARPDVVLLSQPAMQQQVNRAGLKTVLVQFQNYEGLKKTVSITAEVIGGNAPQIAKQYNAELDANIRLVSERTKNIPDTQKPLVLHISDGGNLRKIDGGRSIVGDWIRIAGGAPRCPTPPTSPKCRWRKSSKPTPTSSSSAAATARRPSLKSAATRPGRASKPSKTTASTPIPAAPSAGTDTARKARCRCCGRANCSTPPASATWTFPPKPRRFTKNTTATI
ncbi:ABC transporter substrate-binding protein [Kingella potus]|nr:ABC transporter substrate-binding protein [Kingella potus]UOP01699.1 ABC transporter substrate-binding protein [Kingella potus]